MYDVFLRVAEMAIGKSSFVVGMFCAMSATAVWAGNFIIARGFHHSLSPITLSFWRWVVASSVLVPIALGEVIRQKELIVEHFGFLFVTALIGVSGCNTLIYMAGQVTSAVNLSLIAMTAPLGIVILASFFLGESLTFGKILGMLTAFAGVVLLFSRGSVETLVNLSFNGGDLLMVAGASCFAIYSLLVRRVPAGFSTLGFLSIIFWMGTLLLFPLYLWDRGTSWAPMIPMDSVAVVLYAGVGASLCGFALWNRSVSLIGAGRAAAIYYLLPLFSGIDARIFLGESITWVQGVSGALILFGVFFSSREKRN